jgi:dTDP-4-dehydrorhamnose reductase
VSVKYDLKLDYLRKPLSLYDDGKLYPMFTDQQVSIALVDEVAKALEKIIDGNCKGIFHAGSCDTSTPFELVSYMIEKARGVKNAVKGISLDDFLKNADNPVRYPKFGGLEVKRTEKELGIKFSTWKQIVDKLTKGAV